MIAWEVFSICWLDRLQSHGQPRSTISAVVSELFHLWPPLYGLAVALFLFFLWHCSDLSNQLKP